MKDRIKVFIEVILMIGLSLAVLTLLSMHEDKTPRTVINIIPVVETVPSEPDFMNQTPDEGLRDALEYYDIECPDIVYAQAILETGYFKSDVCINRNNLFGLYNSRKKEYYKFKHWSESVVAYKEWIQKRYEPQEDYYSFLRRINYASDPQYTDKLKKIVSKNT